MYFNQNKEDTNIDKEFKNNNKFDFNKYKKPLIIAGIVLLLLIIILIIIFATRNRTRYFITLEGSEEMTIYQGSTYTDPGYKGFDNKQNTYEVNVNGDVDTSKIGTYTITYSLNNAKRTRTVNVITRPDIITIIHLKGDINMKVKQGTTFTDPGYTAVDAIDGDLTNKVTTSGTVDTSTKGTYRIIYSVINSSGVTTSETRIVTVE